MIWTKSRHGFRSAAFTLIRVRTDILRTSFRDAILRNHVLLFAPGINEAVIIQFRSYSAFRLTTDDIVLQITLSCLWPTWLGLERMSIFRFTCSTSANYATLPLSTLEPTRTWHVACNSLQSFSLMKEKIAKFWNRFFFNLYINHINIINQFKHLLITLYNKFIINL